MVEVEEQVESAVLEQITEQKNLVVYNDDFNTFDHVINSLIKVCGHDTLQAEQCTMIIHYNGKCQVKVGTTAKLTPLCLSLLDKGITAEIE
ncbi:MAG: ATP-dependent Clp protease adaptor ClpS [Bacteroidota bacterium]